MHASRAFFVSGQQQQIFFPDLIPTFWVEAHLVSSAGVGADEEFPMFLSLMRWIVGGVRRVTKGGRERGIYLTCQSTRF